MIEIGFRIHDITITHGQIDRSQVWYYKIMTLKFCPSKKKIECIRELKIDLELELESDSINQNLVVNPN